MTKHYHAWLAVPVLLLAFLTVPLLAAAQEKTLVFGLQPLEKPAKMFEMYQPLVQYLEKELGRPIRLEVGKDYDEAIRNFQSGAYDLGMIGPAPYLMAIKTNPAGGSPFQLLGTIATDGKPHYQAVIFVSKDNRQIKTLKDLDGKKFAFGSRRSTLSFYLPAKMLMDGGAMDKLESHAFLGKHDAVVNAVVGGHMDAGAIKDSIAVENQDKIRVIATSEPLWDFLLVAHRGMDPKLAQKLRSLALGLKNPEILEKINPGTTGFLPTDHRNYEPLGRLMDEVDARMGTGK